MNDQGVPPIPPVVDPADDDVDATAFDTSEAEVVLPDDLEPDVGNGDLGPSQLEPEALGAAGDPGPEDYGGRFAGMPLTDDEVDALPVEEEDDEP